MTRESRAIWAAIIVLLILDYQRVSVLTPSIGIGLVLGGLLYAFWPQIKAALTGRRPG